MPDTPPPQNDFWSLLEEAEETVERWPEWQRRYVVADKTTKSDYSTTAVVTSGGPSVASTETNEKLG